MLKQTLRGVPDVSAAQVRKHTQLMLGVKIGERIAHD